MRCLAVLVILAMVCAPARPARAAGRVLWVDDSWKYRPAGSQVGNHIIGTDAFATIQQAVNAATAGDSIHVFAGSYTENVVVNVSVVIVAVSGPTATRLNANHAGHGFAIGAHNVTIEGFEIVNADGADKAGISVGGSSPLRGITLRRNVIHNCYYGIYLAATGDGSANIVAENEVYGCLGTGILLWDPASTHGNSSCQVLSNRVHDNQGGGIRLGAPSACTNAGNLVRGNTVYDNGAEGVCGPGIHLSHADNNVISFNAVYGHTLGTCPVGLYLAASTGNDMLYNDAHHNGDGALCASSSGNNTLRGNKFMHNAAWGVRVADEGSTTTVVTSNRIMGNGSGAIANEGASTLSAEYNYYGRSVDPPPVFDPPVDSEPKAGGWVYPGDDPAIYMGESVAVPLYFWLDDMYGFQATVRYDTAPLDYITRTWDTSWFWPDERLYDGVGDEGAGTVRFVATQLRTEHPAPVSGDEKRVVELTFRGMAQGTSAITLGNALAATIDGEPIYLATGGALVIVGPQRAPLTGSVRVQGRPAPPGPPPPHWDGAEITMGIGGFSDISRVDGTYALTPTLGTYDVYIEMPRYLDACATGIVVGAEGRVLAQVKLLGGDANDDDIVDILDMTLIGGQYGLSGGEITKPNADINDDGRVDILDLVLAAGNYTSTYSPWTP